jgi:hypothetical protein
MNVAAKTFDSMRNNPKGWRISEIEAICRKFGIACEAPSRGSHYTVSHESQSDILTIPADRPVQPVYVRKLVAFVDLVKGASE